MEFAEPEERRPLSSSTAPHHDATAPVAAPAAAPDVAASAAPAPAEIRAERRRLVGSVQAVRRLLGARASFERADVRRLTREARARVRAAAAHGKALQRIHERQARGQESLTRRLNRLDPRREQQERQALAVLRRESVQRTLAGTRLTAGEVNGIGAGLVRALAERGISTAADFKRVSWGKAPGGKGGEVLYIHRTSGGRVHINGIGEHRGRPLMAWRQAAVARAEARAPRELPPDERHRIAEIIETERSALRQELARLPQTADAERREAARVHSEHLTRLGAAHREAAERSAERRAEFDALAEQLLTLQAELAAHIARFGDVGRRVRRAQSRAMRPLPAVPVAERSPGGHGAGPAAGPHRRSPSGGAPDPSVSPTAGPSAGPPAGPTGHPTAGPTGHPAPGPTGHPAPGPTAGPPAAGTPFPSSSSTPASAASGSADAFPASGTADAFPAASGVRAGLGWLVPIVFFGLTAILGAGEPEEGGTPLWFAVGTRLAALALTADLLRLWLPRRRWHTAAPMPRGTGPLCTGVLLALAGAGMFADARAYDNGAPWAVSVVAALFLLTGAGLRRGPRS
jgi:hypothetical protein